MRGLGTFAHDAAQGSDQIGSGGAKLVVMMEREFAEDSFSFGGECEQNFAAVLLSARTVDEATGFEAVDQFHGAVVADLHTVGQFADAGADALGHALDGEHELVLSAFKAGVLYDLLAEVEEAANLVTEFRECLVV